MVHSLPLAPFLQISQISDRWIEIALLVLVLAVIWFALRLVFRMAMRVFTAGCIVIVVLGLILLAFRYFS